MQRDILMGGLTQEVKGQSTDIDSFSSSMVAGIGCNHGHRLTRDSEGLCMDRWLLHLL